MTNTPSFDFRSHLGSREIPARKPTLVGQLVVGVAADERGVVFAALPDTDMNGRLITEYDNVVIGPIENDWERLAKFLDHLPKILGPRPVACIALQIEEGRFAGIVPDLLDRLRHVFPEVLTTVKGKDLQTWITSENCQIALPDLPEDEPWVVELLTAAAATAAGMLNGYQSKGQPDDTGSKCQFSNEKPNGAVSLVKQLPVAASTVLVGPERQSSPSATAINFTNPYLYIATVRSDFDGQHFLEENRTHTLKLDNRSGPCLRELQQHLKELFDAWNLDTVAMRIGDEKGPYVLNANAYKVEAALQLLDDLHVIELSVAEVSGFARTHDRILPTPQPHLKTRAQQAGQRHAIRAAGLALSRMEKEA